MCQRSQKKKNNIVIKKAVSYNSICVIEYRYHYNSKAAWIATMIIPNLSIMCTVAHSVEVGHPKV